MYYATETFRSRIEQTGAFFRGYGPQFAFEQDGGPQGLPELMRRSIETAETLLPELLDSLQATRPAYLLIDSMCVWGHLLQQLLGCPAVTSCSTFAFNRQVGNALRRSSPGRLSLNDLASAIRPLVRYFRSAHRIDRRYGTCTPSPLAFVAGRQALNLIYTSREFQPCGAQFDESYRFVGPSIAPRHETVDFPFERLGAEPLVYISMGTVFNDLADFYHTCFEAFSGRPYQVVMSVGKTVDPRTLGAPPPNFMVRAYVPQLELLERAALFVTHGGMNSVSEALLAHVPMLVIPRGSDQFLVGAQVGALGLGLPLQAAQATPQRLRMCADQVLAEPAYRRRCGVMGESLRAAGGYGRAADEIFAWKQRTGLAA
jgi:MGT family glycosyltransferase